MQERALILYMLVFASNGPLVASAVVAAYLLCLFLIGYAELYFLKSRGAAALTWLLGIGALSMIAVQRATLYRIPLGIAIFVCGVAFVLVFLRRYEDRR